MNILAVLTTSNNQQNIKSLTNNFSSELTKLGSNIICRYNAIKIDEYTAEYKIMADIKIDEDFPAQQEETITKAVLHNLRLELDEFVKANNSTLELHLN